MTAGGRLRLAVLISGQGSNLLAIERACAAGSIRADVVQVIADRAAPGIAAAQRLGLAARILTPQPQQPRAAYDQALAAAIDASGAELVVLAGFMRILSPEFVAQYCGRLLNIHPSLLPGYKGLHTHRRVLQAGEPLHGASVHFVTAELDGGPVICQAQVPVLSGDSEQSLSARVQQQEHRIYPMVIGWIASGRLRWTGRSIELDGAALSAPVVVSNDIPDAAAARLS